MRLWLCGPAPAAHLTADPTVRPRACVAHGPVSLPNRNQESEPRAAQELVIGGLDDGFHRCAAAACCASVRQGGSSETQLRFGACHCSALPCAAHPCALASSAHVHFQGQSRTAPLPTHPRCPLGPPATRRLIAHGLCEYHSLSSHSRPLPDGSGKEVVVRRRAFAAATAAGSSAAAAAAASGEAGEEAADAAGPAGRRPPLQIACSDLLHVLVDEAQPLTPQVRCACLKVRAAARVGVFRSATLQRVWSPSH